MLHSVSRAVGIVLFICCLCEVMENLSFPANLRKSEVKWKQKREVFLLDRHVNLL
jgi:hypothetical protein